MTEIGRMIIYTVETNSKHVGLYIKGIEEVLWYICISETTHNLGKVEKKSVFIFQNHKTYSEWLKYILVYSCKHRSTSFVHVEDVLRWYEYA